MSTILPKKSMSEEDIKLQYITPAITAKWDIHKITMETKLTDGKINLKGNFVVREKPDCCLGLAPGSSPVGMYQELARRCRDEGLDFSKARSVNLDEYVGLSGDHDQSYRYFMDTNLFNHINIDKANTYVAKGIGDIGENLREFNEVLDNCEINVQVLGVGPDGHLGFNEPSGELFDGAHKEVLDESTIDANARFFASRDDVPRYAVTMGMGNIMRAKKLADEIGYKG